VFELFTWPGKVWGDAYRATLIPCDSRYQQWQVVLSIRASIIVGNSIMLVISMMVMGVIARFHAVILVVLVLAGVVFVGMGGERTPGGRAVERLRGRGAGQGLLWAMFAATADLASIGLIAYSVAGVDPWSFLPHFYVLSALAGLAGLPFGFGVIEAGGFSLLSAVYGIDSVAAMACLMIYRITGPGLTFVLGVAFLSGRTGVGMREFFKRRKRLSDAMFVGLGQ